MEFYMALASGKFFTDPLLNTFAQAYMFLDFSDAASQDVALFAPGVSNIPSSALLVNDWASGTVYGCGCEIQQAWWQSITEYGNPLLQQFSIPTFPETPPSATFLPGASPAGHGGQTNGYNGCSWVLKCVATRVSCSILLNLQPRIKLPTSLAFLILALAATPGIAIDNTSLGALIERLLIPYFSQLPGPSGQVVSVAASVDSLATGARLATYSADYFSNKPPTYPAKAEMAYGSMGSKSSTALNAACIVQSLVKAETAVDLVKAMFTQKVVELLDDTLTDKAFCGFTTAPISGGEDVGFASYCSTLFPAGIGMDRITVGQCCWMQSGIGDLLPDPDLEMLKAYASIAFGPLQWLAQAGLPGGEAVKGSPGCGPAFSPTKS
jgi:hypothetical protein